MARPLQYRCPTTGYQVNYFLACEPVVQHSAAAKALGKEGGKSAKHYAVLCLSCHRQHLINVGSPRLMNDERVELVRELQTIPFEGS